LSDCEFDVLVIGGGASGAATAREAALRGLRTALIERDDFGGGALGALLKVVHGGIRYLQHGDVRRLRHYCGEPLGFLAHRAASGGAVAILQFPLTAGGRSSKWFLGTGMRILRCIERRSQYWITDKSRQSPGHALYRAAPNSRVISVR